MTSNSNTDQWMQESQSTKIWSSQCPLQNPHKDNPNSNKFQFNQCYQHPPQPSGTTYEIASFTSTWELIQYKTLQHITHTKANHHVKHLESSCFLQTLLMPKLYVVVSLPDWTYKIKIAQMTSPKVTQVCGSKNCQNHGAPKKQSANEKPKLLKCPKYNNTK